MINQSILDAFNMMWKNFPEPVLLVQKNRTVLAVNGLAQAAGIQPGIKCYSLNPEGPQNGACRNCEANNVLSQGAGICKNVEVCGTPVRGYWVPLEGEKDLYLHFQIK